VTPYAAAMKEAVHLLRNPLHSAGAYAKFAGNLVDGSDNLFQSCLK
jgi:hypothetical protein